ncbi:MAG: CapA family protein [Coriobacteriia bacterium]|nr:CapA family protein [Coriobacteriia bacterium]
MSDESSNNDNKNAWSGSWHSESESHWHSSRTAPGRFTGSWYNGRVNDPQGKSAELVDGKVVWSNTPQKNPAANQYTAPMRHEEPAEVPAPRTPFRQPPLESNPSNPASPNVNRGKRRSSVWGTPIDDEESGNTHTSKSRTVRTNDEPSPQGSSNTSSTRRTTARRRTGSGRSFVDYGATSSNEQQQRNAPSWYDTSNAAKDVVPRSVLDEEFRGGRRDVPSQQSLRFSGPERPRKTHVALPSFKAGNPNQPSSLPFGLSLNVLLGIVLAILIIIAAFLLTACSCSDGTAKKDEGMTVNDTANSAVPTSEFTISFAGDCSLGTDENFDSSTNFTSRVNAENKDYSYFLAKVKEIFDADDLTVVNFEGTLTKSTSRADKKFAFKGPAEYAKILTEGGVEAASTANNHSHDYGESSYTDTLKALKNEGITSFGYDDIAYMDVKGTKVALIGTYELAEGVGIKDEMVSKIKEARDNGAQVIIDYIHWGIEREAVPDSDQRTLGHAAIDAGATLVIGSHPHVIQGYEKYNDRYIVYSMGNFCFGGNANPTDKDTWIFQQTFKVEGDNIDTNNINVIPCSLSGHSSYNDYQPTPASGSEKKRIANKIKERSDAIA